MTLGPNTKAVQEIERFVQHGAILVKQSEETLPKDFPTVLDFEQAKILAYDADYGTQELTWTDIREWALRPLRAAEYDRQETRPYINALQSHIRLFYEEIRDRLAGTKYKEIANDISADLYCCAEVRCLFGIVNGSFHEQMFKIYQAGGWPCGWEGDYPEGRMRVFFRIG